MNFYPFHIGDYAVHTRHLTLMEDLAYRRLLDLYYTRETPLPDDVGQVARLIGMREYAVEVAAVLDEFFSRGDGYLHVRCDEEIKRMQSKQVKAKASAQASVNARSTNAQRTLNERSATVELPIPIPIPIPIPRNTVGDAKRRKQIPLDFFPDETGLKVAASKGVSADAELQKFKDFHAAKGSVMLDWQAAWRTWCNNAKQFAPRFTQTESSITVPGKPGIDPALAKAINDQLICKAPPQNIREQIEKITRRAA